MIQTAGGPTADRHLATAAAIAAFAGGSPALFVLRLCGIRQASILVGPGLVLLLAAIGAGAGAIAAARTSQVPWSTGSGRDTTEPRSRPASVGAAQQAVEPVPPTSTAWWNADISEPRAPRRSSVIAPPALPQGRAGVTVAIRPDHDVQRGGDPHPAGAAATRIVQCPSCGGFAVDLQRREAGLSFQCTSCRHGWTWRAGSAWPATVIRPRRGAAHP